MEQRTACSEFEVDTAAVVVDGVGIAAVVVAVAVAAAVAAAVASRKTTNVGDSDGAVLGQPVQE